MAFLWNAFGQNAGSDTNQGRRGSELGPTLSSNGDKMLKDFRASVHNHLPNLGGDNHASKNQGVIHTTSLPSTAASENTNTPAFHLRKQFDAKPMPFKVKERIQAIPLRNPAMQVDRNFLRDQREFGFLNAKAGQQPGVGGAYGGMHPLQKNEITHTVRKQSVHTLYEGTVIAEISQSVKKPDNISANLWLANNFVKIFKEISMVSSFMLAGACTEQSCPTMRAGTHNYLWQDHNPDGTVTSGVPLSAPKYIKAVLDTAQNFLNDRRVFPTHGGEFPECFQELVGPVVRRFFRCYCHFYRHHLQQMEELGIEKRVRFCAAFCSLFCLEHDLCTPVEYETISPLIDAWVKEVSSVKMSGSGRMQLVMLNLKHPKICLA
ncbi:unnamed protein product [Amoebophrya sp. A120]|nr:unnamed protein product [Amoebophrya sp. A120]|eukprot:GSA120T00025381001.1